MYQDVNIIKKKSSQSVRGDLDGDRLYQFAVVNGGWISMKLLSTSSIETAHAAENLKYAWCGGQALPQGWSRGTRLSPIKFPRVSGGLDWYEAWVQCKAGLRSSMSSITIEQEIEDSCDIELMWKIILVLGSLHNGPPFQFGVGITFVTISGEVYCLVYG
ncbi:hypothetical protein B0H17DRAFT_1131851 [Mycena rosella]|uniref:Uncharacterized protein n=1 Tax=Mycena rosella TaxID=1033263 RepID=A0AAD7DNN3_MYCRO|nr:hypothetical protein B0H17DRAFT_1131851 [Mycena rosella]